MTIWILAILVITAGALAGWRQGGIRAGIAFLGIFFGALLAAPVGHLMHPLLPHLGASSPITTWAVAPIVGFVLISIVFMVIAQPVHKKVEIFYKYHAGDLRLALWERLNTRTGICIGVLNGALYFILISFILFNMAYVTSQTTGAAKSSALVRLVNQLGQDMQTSGFSRTASAVGTLPATYYELADLGGFLVQNPQAASRLAEYPALTSLWEREDMQALVNDSTLTNALATGASMSEILQNENVKNFLANKDQTKLVIGILQTNLSDLTHYLLTGKSTNYTQKLIGEWDFNPAVTLAWMRQNNPKMPASEMRSIRAWMTQAYANTTVLATGDNQLFMKNVPKLKNNGPGQPPTTDYVNWKGDWTANGDSYDLHLTSGGEDKFYTATAEDLRLTIKDGKTMLIFDRAN